MGLRLATIKGSFLLSFGHIVAFGCSFIRNIILARMLTKADFGIAATFGMIVSLLEFSDKWALDRQIIQSREAITPAFMGTVQFLQFLIGISSAMLMLLAAPLLAHLFSVPELVPAFVSLAIIPLSKAFYNLDISRMVRDMRFGPQVLIEILPQLFITLAAWPMAAWLQDYRALLWLLLVRWCMTVVASHVVAERPYRWAFQRSTLGQAMTFGWPLVINGFLLFGITQGDRMVVGIAKSMADLGTYSVAAQVTLIPGLMFASVLSSLLLPIMSRAQEDRDGFRAKYRLCAQLMTVFAASFAAFLTIAGDGIVTLAFGDKYAGSGTLITLLVAAQALRLMRVAPTIAAMAKGDTQNVMFANGARLLGLVLAAALAMGGAGLIGVAVGGLCGEMVSYMVSARRFSQRHDIRLSDSALPAVVCMAPVALFATVTLLYRDALTIWVGLPLGLGAAMVSAALALLTLRDLQSEAYKLLTFGLSRARVHCFGAPCHDRK